VLEQLAPFLFLLLILRRSLIVGRVSIFSFLSGSAAVFVRALLLRTKGHAENGKKEETR
jgi:hypothetical protein